MQTRKATSSITHAAGNSIQMAIHIMYAMPATVADVHQTG